MKDMKKYQKLPSTLDRNPHFFTDYPELINRAAHAMITVDGVDKRTKERDIMKSFVSKRSRLGLLGDMLKLWRAFE